jgi:dTDP-4-dehydrorhamnose 3,5-epimerase
VKVDAELGVTPEAERDVPQGRIEGVELFRVTPYVDHRGSLTEVVNFDHPFWREEVVYAYCFTIAPGRIKGWGMHKLQSDRYFLVRGSVRTVLYDGREGSSTLERYEVHNLTAANSGLLLIPPGVWHASQNWGEDEAAVMNFPTRPFDRETPDKYRIDPHSGEIPFDWSLPDG